MAKLTDYEKSLISNIRSFNDMSNDEVCALHTWYTTGSPAFRTRVEDEVIKKNEYLILACIRKYFNSYFGHKDVMDDLIQAGRIAIFEQFNSFDPNKSKFSTYIMSHMVGHMKTVLSLNVNKIPKHYYSKNQKIEKAIEDLKKKGYSNPSIGQISEHTGLPPVTIQHALSCKNLASTSYIEELSGNELSYLKDDIQDIVEERAIRETVVKSVSKLSKVHRMVVALTFGLADSPTGSVLPGKTYSDSEIAKHLKTMGIDPVASTAKVKRVRVEAMDALRRDENIAHLYENRRIKREDILQGFTLTLIPEPAVLEYETRKLDALCGDGLDFDFSTEMVSSIHGENNSVTLAEVLEPVNSDTDDFIKLAESALEGIEDDGDAVVEDYVPAANKEEEDPSVIYVTEDIAATKIADGLEECDNLFATSFFGIGGA